MLSLELPSGPLTVICLAAHPDDIEIASGGTLLELAARGDVTGHWLTLTGDSARAAEAVAAAEAFLPGARTEFHRLLGRLASMVWRERRDLAPRSSRVGWRSSTSNLYVPISAENGRRKVDLLNKHYPSQARHDWWDDEMFLGLMRIRGMECRSRYAEGF